MYVTNQKSYPEGDLRIIVKIKDKRLPKENTRTWTGATHKLSIQSEWFAGVEVETRKTYLWTMYVLRSSLTVSADIMVVIFPTL